MKTRIGSASAVAMAVLLGTSSFACAADPPDLFTEHLADFLWIGSGGNNTWQNAANWTPPTGMSGQFPDDPGRQDMNEQMIDPVEGANLSRALASDLTVNILDTSVTVASLKLGGTTSAVSTNVTASKTNPDGPAVFLVFENQESNDNLTNPADPNTTPPTLAEPIWSFNQGVGLIWSTGTKGANKKNEISANIKLNDLVDVEGDRDLYISGDLVEGDRLTAAGATDRPSGISNLLSGGATLFLEGNVITTIFDDDTEMPGTQDRRVLLNASSGVVLPSNPQRPTPSEQQVMRAGRIEMTGQFIGDGWVEIGTTTGTVLPLGTVILSGDSRDDPMVKNVMREDPQNPEEMIEDPYYDLDPFFNGRLHINRGNVVLDHDGALGSGDVKTGNPNQGFGFNFISTSNDRDITTDFQIAQWQTVRGASDIPGLEEIGDHSIKFSGVVNQSNSRGWVNLLPAGETLELNGSQYPLQGEDNADLNRIYTIDGSGRTLVTGGIHNRLPDGTEPGVGHFRVRGTGTVVVDWDDEQRMIPDPNDPTGMAEIPDPEDKHSSYAGYTWVEGGNLEFGENEDMGEGLILSRGGAVAVNEGVVGNSTFLQKLNNSSAPLGPNANEPFFLLVDNSPVYTTFSTGGLMLAANEYNQNLDFTSGDLARAANMTLAARGSGSTYTGTITPSSTVKVNPNTYQLGGGGGVLTLPNNNQLTGARKLLVTNGSEVRLQGTNDYTGQTRIVGKFLPSVQNSAAANRRDDEATTEDGSTDTYRRSTLTVTHLGNAGAASSIGNSSSSADNLQIQGSTLKYMGAATSTDRLFTVGTVGATIEASGTGTLNFTNSGAVGIDVAEARTGVIATGVPGTANNEIFGRQVLEPSPVPFSTEDLVPGMRIAGISGSGTGFVNNLRIGTIQSVDAVTVGLDSDEEGATWGGFTATAVQTISFGPAPARMLTLTGTNAGNNTLAPLVGDAADKANKPEEPMNPTPQQQALYDEQLQEYEDGYGTVGIRKTGAGKWILTGNNTYSGPTNVEAGTLIVNGAQSGNGTTTVSMNANLGGGGTLPGALINRGLVAPGATTTGTLTVQGNYRQNSGASLAIEIGGTAAGSFDALHVVEGVEITDPLEGDYNDDGAVNAADYTVWRDHLGETFELLNEGGNDDDDDGVDESLGVVGPEDYDNWKENFGEEYLYFGVASLSGTIDIDLINGFTPTPGSIFTIVDAPEGLTAANLSLSGESNGFDLIVNATSLVLQYTGTGVGALAGAAVPEPSSVTLLLLAGLVGLRRYRRFSRIAAG